MAVFVIFSKMIYFTIIFILVYFMDGQKEYVQQRDHSALLLVSIPLTSVFIMLTLLIVNDTYILSPALIAAVTLDAVFLLAINLLVFGINQYKQKKKYGIYGNAAAALKRSKPGGVLSNAVFTNRKPEHSDP